MTRHEAGSRRRARRAQKLGSDSGAGAGDLAEQQRGDQEAGDDEEHVDADEAAAERADVGVEQHHQRDGDGPQALDVGAEADRRERERFGGDRLSAEPRSAGRPAGTARSLRSVRPMLLLDAPSDDGRREREYWEPVLAGAGIEGQPGRPTPTTLPQLTGTTLTTSPVAGAWTCWPPPMYIETWLIGE